MRRVAATGMTMADPVVLGISLKMYFDHEGTIAWCRGVRDLLGRRQLPDALELIVLPSSVSLPAAAEAFAGTTVRLGVQDLFWEDRGPFTGAVGGPSVRQIGCRYAEVGHAERRRIFHENLQVFAAKTVAAVRNRLTPIICVGEQELMPADEAAAACVRELDRILSGLVEQDRSARLIIAYEPEWAIGADTPAPVEHIITVCDAVSAWLARRSRFLGSNVIYGGTAGPGLLTRLAGHADGLFLGRAAHDLDALESILEEVTPDP